MPNDRAVRRRMRWYNSLFFRVILLCGVLVLCLLGSVIVITRHYFGEVVEEMQTRTSEILQSVLLEFKERPDVDYNPAYGKRTRCSAGCSNRQAGNRFDRGPVYF